MLEDGAADCRRKHILRCSDRLLFSQSGPFGRRDGFDCFTMYPPRALHSLARPCSSTSNLRSRKGRKTRSENLNIARTAGEPDQKIEPLSTFALFQSKALVWDSFDCSFASATHSPPWQPLLGCDHQSHRRPVNVTCTWVFSRVVRVSHHPICHPITLDVVVSGPKTLTIRSCTLSIAWLMLTKGLDYDEAYSRVRRGRPICAPNTGFICSLLEWQRRRQKVRHCTGTTFA